VNFVPTVRISDVERKRINAWLVKRYGDGVLNHPVFDNVSVRLPNGMPDSNPQVEVEGLPEVTDQSISSTES